MKLLIFGFLVAIVTSHPAENDKDKTLSPEQLINHHATKTMQFDHLNEEIPIFVDVVATDEDMFLPEVIEKSAIFSDMLEANPTIQQINDDNDSIKIPQTSEKQVIGTVNNDQFYLDPEIQKENISLKETIDFNSKLADSNIKNVAILHQPDILQDIIPPTIQTQLKFPVFPPSPQIPSTNFNKDVLDNPTLQTLSLENAFQSEINAEHMGRLFRYNPHLLRFPPQENIFYQLLRQHGIISSDVMPPSFAENSRSIEPLSYDNLQDKYVAGIDYGNIQSSINRHSNYLNANNDYTYNADYVTEPEYPDINNNFYNTNSGSIHHNIEDIPEYIQNIIPPTALSTNKANYENRNFDGFVSHHMPTYYKPIGRIAIYEIHRPHLAHLQSMYRSQDASHFTSPDSIMENNGFDARSGEADHWESSSKDKNKRVTELNKQPKQEKRNAEDKKYGIKDSIISKTEFIPQDQYHNSVRRYDAPGLSFTHGGPLHSTGASYRLLNSLNLHGNRGTIGSPNRFPPQQYGRDGFPYRHSQHQGKYYGALGDRELRHIMFRVFGI